MRSRKSRRHKHRHGEPKARTQHRHAQIRFLERHGLEVSGRELQMLVAQIQSGEARFVERQSLRASVWDVELEGKARRVIYDRKRKTIVTVFDPSWVEEGGSDE